MSNDPQAQSESGSRRRLSNAILPAVLGVISVAIIVWALVTSGAAARYLGLRTWQVPGTAISVVDHDWICSVESQGGVLRVYRADISTTYTIGTLEAVLESLPEKLMPLSIRAEFLEAGSRLPDEDAPVHVVSLERSNQQNPTAIAIYHEFDIVAVVTTPADVSAPEAAATLLDHLRTAK